MKEVTDPNLLAQLEVTDPALLAQLNAPDGPPQLPRSTPDQQVRTRAGAGETLLGIGEGALAAGGSVAGSALGMVGGLGNAAIARLRGQKPREAYEHTLSSVEQALSYEPRTDAGQRITAAGGDAVAGALGPVMAPVMKAADASDAYWTSKGYPMGGLLAREVVAGAPFALAGPAGNAARKGVAGGLRGVAERNAVRSTGGKAALKDLQHYGPSPRAVGRQLLDEKGVPLRNPEAAQGAVQRIRGTAGQDLGNLAAQADASGVRFRLADVWDDLKPTLDRLDKDPQLAKHAESIREYLRGNARTRGVTMKPSEAHALRQDLDEFLRGAEGTQNPNGSLSKSYTNEVRQAVSRRLQQTMDRAGVGEKWAPANQRFRNLRGGEDLLEAGVNAREREAFFPGSDSTSVRMFGLKMPTVRLSHDIKGTSPRWAAGKARTADAIAEFLDPRSRPAGPARASGAAPSAAAGAGPAVPGVPPAAPGGPAARARSLRKGPGSPAGGGSSGPAPAASGGPSQPVAARGGAPIPPPKKPRHTVASAQRAGDPDAPWNQPKPIFAAQDEAYRQRAEDYVRSVLGEEPRVAKTRTGDPKTPPPIPKGYREPRPKGPSMPSQGLDPRLLRELEAADGRAGKVMVEPKLLDEVTGHLAAGERGPDLGFLAELDSHFAKGQKAPPDPVSELAGSTKKRARKRTAALRKGKE